MMSEDKLNSGHKALLGPLPQCESGQMGHDCLLDAELAEYVDNIVTGRPQQEKQIRHTLECDYCFSRTASAVAALKSFNNDLSIKGYTSAVKKAMSIPRLHKRPKIGVMRRNRYLLIAAVFFMLSFIFKVYFLQFLLAALVFGLKWVMDTGGSKALIMIYDTWRCRKDTRREEDSREKNPRI